MLFVIRVNFIEATRHGTGPVIAISNWCDRYIFETLAELYQPFSKNPCYYTYLPSSLRVLLVTQILRSVRIMNLVGSYLDAE